MENYSHMELERLSFSSHASSYHTMTAAEHVSRYYIAQQHCNNRHVLDMGCGEGYGSFLMKSWGAVSVTGLDISHDAINNAQKHFASAGLKFVQCDISDAAHVLAPTTYDLIIVSEVLEHVSDMHSVFLNLTSLSHSKTIIIVTFPNRAIEEHSGFNPYHIHHLDLPQFQLLSESHLGKAQSWKLGAPIQGYCAISVDAPLLSNNAASNLALLENHLTHLPALVIPSQTNLQLRPELSHYFVGIWGATTKDIYVTSPQSYFGFIEPWEVIYQQRELISSLQITITRFEESRLGKLRKFFTRTRTVLNRILRLTFSSS